MGWNGRRGEGTGHTNTVRSAGKTIDGSQRLNKICIGFAIATPRGAMRSTQCSDEFSTVSTLSPSLLSTRLDLYS